MNLNILEKMARQALKGANVSEKSNGLAKMGMITRAEHRSLNSFAWQNGGSAGTCALTVDRLQGSWA
ncbi:MAG TPA: hypothetical protein VEW94_02200 [Chloroflexia bacterium]|nr:hypothetical protein [Chloroflexia bacterium]